MLTVLSKAVTFIAIIIIGIVLRHVGLFKERDFYVVSNIVMKITLPAMIVYNFAEADFELSLLLLALVGAGTGLLLIAIIYVVDLKKSKDVKAYDMLNIAGYNIGNFTLPFVQSFLGSGGVVATSIFDIGNAMICFGGAYSMAAMVKGEEGKSSPMIMLKSLAKSPPFVTYIVMVILYLLNIHLPQPIITFAQTAGNANPFLAMLMIGISFKFPKETHQLKRMLKILIVRYAVSFAFALVIFNYLPMALEYRQALTILVFSPMASAIPVFTADLKGDIGLSSAINSVSIIISIVAIISVLLIII